jgi:hypothetical protein
MNTKSQKQENDCASIVRNVSEPLDIAEQLPMEIFESLNRVRFQRSCSVGKT